MGADDWAAASLRQIVDVLWSELDFEQVQDLRPALPTTTDALLQTIDSLWGELDIVQVLELQQNAPEIVEACRAVHTLVAHAQPPPP